VNTTGSILIFKERIFVHDVIEVGDLPWTDAGLVFDWKQVEEIKPSKVGLELHDVFHNLVIVTTEDDLATVLVQNEQFHW